MAAEDATAMRAGMVGWAPCDCCGDDGKVVYVSIESGLGRVVRTPARFCRLCLEDAVRNLSKESPYG